MFFSFLFVLFRVCSKTSGCEWPFEGVPPDHYYVCVCFENAITMKALCDDTTLVKTWEKVCDVESESDAENFTLVLKWLYNHVVHRIDDKVIQQNEHALYFVENLELNESPWMACLHLFDVYEQKKIHLFFKV